MIWEKCSKKLCTHHLKVYNYFRCFLITSITGHFSLFPLLFGPTELPSKLLLHLSYSLLVLLILPSSFCRLEKSYLFLSIPVFLFTEIVHPLSSLNISLPFLPLLMYSLYSALGILYSFARLYCLCIKTWKVWLRGRWCILFFYYNKFWSQTWFFCHL